MEMLSAAAIFFFSVSENSHRLSSKLKSPNSSSAPIPSLFSGMQLAIHRIQMFLGADGEGEQAILATYTKHFHSPQAFPAHGLLVLLLNRQPKKASINVALSKTYKTNSMQVPFKNAN